MITVSHLTKRFGARVAVDDVSFSIDKGEVVGFLGPNGAGKTTTLRILAGFLGATSGKVVIAGHDLEVDSLQARRSVGYMPEAVPLYPEMRVLEYLRFRAELKRVPRSSRASWVDDAVAKAGVASVAHRRIGHLSKGFRQRVGLADAIVSRPPVVILDEPTAGLDPNQIREARSLVRALGRDHAVLLSTHILSEVEACASRVLLIHQGKMVAEGRTDDLRAMRTAAALDIALRGEPERASTVLRAVAGVLSVERTGGADAGGRVLLRARFVDALARDERERVTEACIAALVGAGIGVHELRPAGGALEDVFAALTLPTGEDGAGVHLPAAGNGA